MPLGPFTLQVLFPRKSTLICLMLFAAMNPDLDSNTENEDREPNENRGAVHLWRFGPIIA